MQFAVLIVVEEERKRRTSSGTKQFTEIEEEKNGRSETNKRRTKTQKRRLSAHQAKQLVWNIRDAKSWFSFSLHIVNLFECYLHTIFHSFACLLHTNTNTHKVIKSGTLLMQYNLPFCRWNMQFSFFALVFHSLQFSWMVICSCMSLRNTSRAVRPFYEIFFLLRFFSRRCWFMLY